MGFYFTWDCISQGYCLKNDMNIFPWVFFFSLAYDVFWVNKSSAGFWDWVYQKNLLFLKGAFENNS